MFVDNNGSCTIWLSADGDASKVDRGNVSNNIFYGTINGEALRVYGNSYQQISVLFNYVVQNIVDNLNTIDLRYVAVNFTGNTLFKNQGAHGLDIWSNDDITPFNQTVELNQLYGNFPGDKFKDSQHGGNNTMLYSAGHYRNKRIRNNWFENRFNFEMSTHNRTSTNEKPARYPTMQVDAEFNYWGHRIGVDNTELVIRARMHDYRDDTNLSMINYAHFRAENITLPQVEGSYETGYCLVGWKLTVSRRCYRYYGGIATYSEAVGICALEKATIVKPNNQFWVDIGKVVQYSQQDYSEQVRAWVDEPEPVRPATKCAIVIDNRYDEADCLDRLPFVCESDQIGALPPTWRDLVYLWSILGVGGFLVLLALVFIIIWCRKAKVRKEQRFERRASLRSSIRSNKYAINNGALTQGSQTNIASSMYGSRNALANRPMTRGRGTKWDGTQSIALTDYTLGETDVDLDDTETVITKKNGYTSTGYAGSVDSSRRGSRDDLSQVSQPIRRDDFVRDDFVRDDFVRDDFVRDDFVRDSEDYIPAVQPHPVAPRAAARPDVVSRLPYNRYQSESPARADYSNDGYSTDHSPKHDSMAPTGEQFQPAVQVAPRGTTVIESTPEDHAYVNTSRLRKEPETVQPTELNRQEMHDQRRPARPSPAPAPAVQMRATSNVLIPPMYSSSRQEPPGYGTATRDDMGPSVRARTTVPQRYGSQPYSLSKDDHLSVSDTKSLDSFDSEFSTSKPPLSYRPYDHHRQYSDEKKPFETDIDSMYSEDQKDSAPYYQQRQYPTQRRGVAAPSPLVRDFRTGYDSDASSQRVYRTQNEFNYSQEQLNVAGGGNPHHSYYGHPPAETDIDAMSEMTDDWNIRGPPVETDF